MDFKKVMGLAIIAVLAFVAIASVATTIVGDFGGSSHHLAFAANSGLGGKVFTLQHVFSCQCG